MTFVSWDKDPTNTIVTGDMTFTAKFNNDGGVPVFFKSVDEDNEPIKALSVPDSFVMSSAVAVVKSGEKLTEKTVPAIGQSLQYPEYSSWDTETVGYVADEPHEFTFTYKYYYSVRFVAEPANIDAEQIVHRGEAAKAPDVSNVDGYLFLGWDNDFTAVSQNMVVNAIMYKLGDANMDNKLNTGDAVEVLRYCAGINVLTDNALKLAGASKDVKVNTGDAVCILRICAGLPV